MRECYGAQAIVPDSILPSPADGKECLLKDEKKGQVWVVFEISEARRAIRLTSL
jgi:hypothetical protein